MLINFFEIANLNFKTVKIRKSCYILFTVSVVK